MEFRVGTSGWSYPHWRGVFYPEDLPQSRWLEHYAGTFDTVELNNTFYRLPAEKTFQGWRRRTPEGFLFAVKASRLITHLRRLRDVEEPLETFLSRARLLGERLGPVLYQLPPGLKADPGLLREFLSLLPGDLLHVVEFRSKDWYTEAVFRLLEAAGVALCVHDMPGSQAPMVATASFAYLRFHGTSGRYAGGYSDAQLEEWARKALTLPGVTVLFAYFNNDIGGHAIANARGLLQALGRATGP